MMSPENRFTLFGAMLRDSTSIVTCSSPGEA